MAARILVFYEVSNRCSQSPKRNPQVMLVEDNLGVVRLSGKAALGLPGDFRILYFRRLYGSTAVYGNYLAGYITGGIGSQINDRSYHFLGLSHPGHGGFAHSQFQDVRVIP